MRWGLRKRAEQRQLRGSIDIDQVKESEHPEEWPREVEVTTEEEGWWVVNEVGEITWVGNKDQGKSKGKGGQRSGHAGGGKSA